MKIVTIATLITFALIASACTVRTYDGARVGYAYQPPVVYEEVITPPPPRVVVVHRHDGYIAYDGRYMGRHERAHRPPAYHSPPRYDNHQRRPAQPVISGHGRGNYHQTGRMGANPVPSNKNNNQNHKRQDKKRRVHMRR